MHGFKKQEKKGLKGRVGCGVNAVLGAGCSTCNGAGGEGAGRVPEPSAALTENPRSRSNGNALFGAGEMELLELGEGKQRAQSLQRPGGAKPCPASRRARTPRGREL